MNRVADILPHNFQSLRGFTVMNGNAHDILLADKRENEIIVTVSIMKVQPIIKSDSTVHAADVSNHFLLFAFFFSSALCLLPEGKAELLMQNSGVKETLDDARSSVRQTLQTVYQTG